MPGTKAQLETFFDKAAAAFNAHKDFTPYLAPNAIVYSVDWHVQYTPRDVAAAYLQHQYEDHPTFGLPSAGKLSIVLNATGTAASMKGVASWKDDHHLAEALDFRCTFIHDEQKGWLFNTMWAADKSDK